MSAQYAVVHNVHFMLSSYTLSGFLFSWVAISILTKSALPIWLSLPIYASNLAPLAASER